MGRLTKSVVADDYIRKYTGADGKLAKPKQEIARLMMANYPDMWPNLGAARAAIRIRTGAQGKKNAQEMKGNPVFRMEKSTIEEGLKKAGIFSMHKGLPPPHKLNPAKWAVLSDIHIPFQHDQALTSAIEYSLRQGCQDLILNGDTMDCYDMSRFSKEIDRPGLGDELEMTRGFLKFLRTLFKGEIIWKIGNHEERMRHYILRNAKELGKLEEVTLEYLLDFKGLKIRSVGREIIKAGKLNILHGHEMGESVFSPVNPARGMFLKGKSSTLFGHNHATSTHSEGNLNNDSIVVHSTGCLCHMDPEYRPYGHTKWNHGAAIVEVFQRGRYLVDNYRILDGEIYH